MDRTQTEKSSTRNRTTLVYQIKVTLKDIRPPIWRRLQVSGDVSLHRLHLILQTALGWTNSHLYEFRIGGKEFGEPDPEWDDEVFNSKRTKLGKAVPSEKATFTYEYDFGDGWEHQVLVEKILPTEAGQRYAVCLAGRRACPPEDCGGPGGYEDLLRILSDPAAETHDEMLEWAGGPIDPEEFDLDEINRQLKSPRRANPYP